MDNWASREDIGSERYLSLNVNKDLADIADWDIYLISLAEQVSLKSKDPSTRVGAVIAGQEHQVLSTGFNGFPIGVQDDIDERYDRPQKYEWTAHAEFNAIQLAARHGTELQGSTLYMNYEPTPCTTCTKAIIQAGIGEVVGPDRPFPGQRTETFDISETMLEEAGVERRTVEYADR